MKRLVLVALALVAALVVFLCLWTTADHDAATELPDAPAARRDRAAAASAQATDEAPATRDAVVDAGTRRAEGPATGPATVRGRCVAAEDQRPLAGIEVSFRGRAETVELARLHGNQPLGLPDPLVTGEDGRFELRFTAHPHFLHDLSLRGAGRVPRYGWFDAFEPGAVEDLGDLAFESGLALTGFVTDPQGTPLAGVGISVQRSRSGLVTSLDPAQGECSGSGTSDLTGGFTIRVLTPGPWPLRTDGDQFEHVSPPEVLVQPVVGASGIHVVVRRRPSIEGTVVDESGAPVDLGGNIKAWARTGWVQVHAVSGEDGAFTLFHTGGRAEAVQIGWEQRAVPAFEALRTEEWIEWGTRGVRLVAKRLPTLELEVVEAGTGNPIEEFAVRVWPADDPGQPPPQHPGRSPGGRARLEGLAPGATLVEVIPKRTDLLISAPVRVLVSAAPRDRVRIELLRATPFSVRVLFADRSPSPASFVELLDPRQVQHLSHETLSFDDRRNMTPGGPGVWGSGSDRGQMVSLLSWAATDEDGRATLHGPATGARLALRVSSPADTVQLVRDFWHPGENGEVEVFVASGAGLDLVARPAAAVGHERAGIRLRKVGEGVVYPKQNESFAFAEGIARARRIPAGTWEVLLSKAAAHDAPIATVKLEEGKTTRLEVDLSRFTPARLSGTVLTGGARLASGVVTLAGPVSRSVPVNDAGEFIAAGVMPGTYELSAAVVTDGGRMQVAHDRFVELTPGADLRIDLDLRVPRTLRLHLLRHDGEPVANVSGSVGGRVQSVRLQTDEHGQARVSPVPGPKVHVRVGSQVVYDCEVPAGPDPGITVRLPAPGTK